jgi:hypothetical protein
MKIDLPQRLDVTPVEVDGSAGEVSTRWRKEQAEAVRRLRPKSRPALPFSPPEAGLLDLLASAPSDFQAIGTEEGMHLLADSIADVERLLAGDPETRQTITLVLQEEIDRWQELQLRRGAGA